MFIEEIVLLSTELQKSPVFFCYCCFFVLKYSKRSRNFISGKERTMVKGKLNKYGLKAIIVQYVWLLVSVLVFSLTAGTINVPNAWLFYTCSLIVTIIHTFFYLAYPERANERGTYKEGTKPIDKVYLGVYFFITVVVFPFIAGLEVGRLGTILINRYVSYGAVIFYFLACYINIWSMKVNRFFEGTIRIQEEREQRVVTEGPYKFIRHPGYLAMIIGSLMTPLILGSFFGVFWALIAIIVLILRTDYEDKVLQEELKGYKEYTQKVKYRLFYGIW